MTQDEIICMARDAGSIDSEDTILTIYAAFSNEKPIKDLTDKELADKDVRDTCDFGDPIPLYAAPLAKQDTHATHVVRTKTPCNPLQDLTDDEIHDVFKSLGFSLANPQPQDFSVARAVIAADRAKNNLCERTK